MRSHSIVRDATLYSGTDNDNSRIIFSSPFYGEIWKIIRKLSQIPSLSVPLSLAKASSSYWGANSEGCQFSNELAHLIKSAVADRNLTNDICAQWRLRPAYIKLWCSREEALGPNLFPFKHHRHVFEAIALVCIKLSLWVQDRCWIYCYDYVLVGLNMICYHQTRLV